MSVMSTCVYNANRSMEDVKTSTDASSWEFKYRNILLSLTERMKLVIERSDPLR